MRRTSLLLVCLAVVLVLVGCIGPGGLKKPQPVTIAMGFIPNVQFTPMYVAVERGYFKEQGIEVTLDYGMETDLLQRVGQDQLQFAIASGDQLILARANGLPVRYLVNWYRRFPVCVVSMADKGITDPQQLVGKTVGTPINQGASYIGWLAFLDEVGIEPDQVNLQVIGYTQVASLLENRVDAAICYTVNEPVQLRAAGHQINKFDLAGYTRLVSNGLISNDKTIKDNPKLVQAVVTAFLRGLEDTIKDPDAAFAITHKAIPEMDEPTAKLQRAVLQECVTLWSGEKLGASQPEDWAESVALLKSLGLITADLEPEQLYTNQFIK